MFILICTKICPIYLKIVNLYIYAVNASAGAWQGALLTVVTSDDGKDSWSEGDFKKSHILFSVYLFDHLQHRYIQA